jgi:hypothetical protein
MVDLDYKDKSKFLGLKDIVVEIEKNKNARI